MILSKRMQMVVDLLPKHCRVADVGCDHGFVSIYLCENEISTGVIAMDVNEGPLKRAREHILEHHLQDKIEIRLSDGLSAIQDGEIDSAVIAGMGGRLVIKILSERLELVKKLKSFVIQPQSDLDLVRNTLNEWGFMIEEENMVEEDGKYYPAMRVSFSGNNNHELSPVEAMYGPLLLASKNPVLLQFLNREIDKYHQIEAKIKENGNGNVSVFERIQLIETALNYFA